MSTIYYYAKKDDVQKFLKYGIKLSENYSAELNLNGYSKQCLIGLLNPKDDIDKFISEEYDCLKVNIDLSKCIVIDGSNLSDSNKLLKPTELKEYTFGTILNPIVPLTTSILPEHLSLLNKDIDCPVLFDNSKDLYYEIHIQQMLEKLSYEDAYLILKDYIGDKY